MGKKTIRRNGGEVLVRQIAKTVRKVMKNFNEGNKIIGKAMILVIE